MAESGYYSADEPPPAPPTSWLLAQVIRLPNGSYTSGDLEQWNTLKQYVLSLAPPGTNLDNGRLMRIKKTRGGAGDVKLQFAVHGCDDWISSVSGLLKELGHDAEDTTDADDIPGAASGGDAAAEVCTTPGDSPDAKAAKHGPTCTPKRSVKAAKAAAAGSSGGGGGTPQTGSGRKSLRVRVRKAPTGQQPAAVAKSGRKPAAAGSSWAARLEAEGFAFPPADAATAEGDVIPPAAVVAGSAADTYGIKPYVYNGALYDDDQMAALKVEELLQAMAKAGDTIEGHLPDCIKAAVEGGVIQFGPALAANRNSMSIFLTDMEGVAKNYLTTVHRTLWEAQQPKQQQRAGRGSPAAARVTAAAAAAAGDDAGSAQVHNTGSTGRNGTGSTARRSQAAKLPLVLDDLPDVADLIAAAAAATAAPPAAALLDGEIHGSAATDAAGDAAPSLLQQLQAGSFTSGLAEPSAADTAAPAPLVSSALLPSTPQPLLPLQQDAASNIITEGVQSPLSLLGTPTGLERPAAAAAGTGATDGSQHDSGGALAAAAGEVNSTAAVSMAAASSAPGTADKAREHAEAEAAGAKAEAAAAKTEAAAAKAEAAAAEARAKTAEEAAAAAEGRATTSAAAAAAAETRAATAEGRAATAEQQLEAAEAANQRLRVSVLSHEQRYQLVQQQLRIEREERRR